ncbi:MAG: alkane 1-monooxygenase [Hellea sp.]|nr:alkane 1-monooxygenase [Hellea sp.]MDG1665843.1 alkane 1-monooxygenase [Hellea sp.]
MTTFMGLTENGSEVIYADKKRHLYWVILASPVISWLSIYLFFTFDKNPIFTLMPMLFFYIFTPLMDFFIGEDEHNPPEEVVNAMMADNYYRFIVHSLIIVSIMLYISFVIFVGTQQLPWWSIIALIIGIGANSGGVMVMTHELGHKSNKLDRFSAKIGNMIMGYGHFNIEHNKGHHTWVATPEDPASSRMGENFYAFMLRELSGTFKRGVNYEMKRLKNSGKGFWCLENDLLQVYTITFISLLIFAYMFGISILIFLIPHHFVAWLALTQANYIEHYGLMRKKLSNGKYERCQPKHSWNTNHTYSNLLSFHLQRHSDHHAYPMRAYQVLRDYDDVPSLPTGYGGCFALAFVPPLWFAIMDKRVMKWAGNDINNVNINTKKEKLLREKWG